MSAQDQRTQSPDRSATDARKTLQDMVWGYRFSQALYVAAKLGIADLLKEGPKSYEELATAAGAHPGALYRLLRMLASVGVFVEVDHGHFTLTQLATLLQASLPGSAHASVILNGERFYRAFGELLYGVKTGQPAFEQVFGMPQYQWLAEHPEDAERHSALLASWTAEDALAMTAAYDFSGIQTCVDVGGGQGALLAALLQVNPGMRGILFDLPHVIEGAKRVIEAAGVGDRCGLVPGDFLTSVPAGSDAYVLKWVLCDWEDEHALTILRHCHRAMQDHGKLLVVEMLIPPGNAPFEGKVIDLGMLVMVPGRYRTEAEYRGLLSAAGFTLSRVIPTQSPRHVSILESVRA